jgi:outer membrane lipoprotein-sorting protein
MTRRLTALTAACGLLALACAAAAQAPQITWELDDALQQLDQQAKNFKTAMARVEVVRVGGDDTEQDRFSGNIFVDKRGYIRIRVDGDRYIILAEPNMVQVYDGEQAIAERYSISEHRDRLEPWLRMGFSTSGQDLSKGYVLTSLGEETVRNHRAIVLEMTPKRAQVREAVRHVRVWIDQASWLPIRHEIARTATGDKLIVDYTQMARNLRLNPALFQDEWPRGTKRVRR